MGGRALVLGEKDWQTVGTEVLLPGDQGANACDRFSSTPRKGRNLGTCDPVDTPTLVCSHTPLARWHDTAPPLSPPHLTGAWYQHLGVYLMFAWK